MPGMNEWITNASLEIYQSGIDVQEEMNILARRLPFYVMSYVQRGRAELRAQGARHALGPGSVVLIPPGVEHDHVKVGEEPTVFMWWHFDYKLYDTLDLLRLLGLPRVFSLDATGAFEAAFAYYTEILREPVSLRSTVLRKASAMMVMGHLLGAAQERGEVGVPESFRAMMETVLACEDAGLTLGDLARRFAMHPTYLSNRFKHYYGISPMALHRRALVQRARDLLAARGMPVTQVAEALGFGSVSVFSRFFTGQTGVPPSQIRAQGSGGSAPGRQGEKHL